MKKIVLIAACALIPFTAMADNIGSCGWGSKLFEGKKGIAPQVLGATTNGTSGNQTFGISSGTSGCTQDGVVTSTWKTAMFVDANKTKLARDMSVGQGESLEALANLVGVEQADSAHFYAATQANFGTIFPNEAVSTDNVLASLKSVLASDKTLAKYSVAV